MAKGPRPYTLTAYSCSVQREVAYFRLYDSRRLVGRQAGVDEQAYASEGKDRGIHAWSWDPFSIQDAMKFFFIIHLFFYSRLFFK
jgi:hypothetical protein